MKNWPLALFALSLFACQRPSEQQAIEDYLLQNLNSGGGLHIDIQRCEQVGVITARDSAALLRITYDRQREKTIGQLETQIRSMERKGNQESAQELQKIMDAYRNGAEISAMAPLAAQINNYENAGDTPLAFRYRCEITSKNDQYPNAQDNSTREFILNKEKTRVLEIPSSE